MIRTGNILSFHNRPTMDLYIESVKTNAVFVRETLERCIYTGHQIEESMSVDSSLQLGEQTLKAFLVHLINYEGFAAQSASLRNKIKTMKNIEKICNDPDLTTLSSVDKGAFFAVLGSLKEGLGDTEWVPTLNIYTLVRTLLIHIFVADKKHTIEYVHAFMERNADNEAFLHRFPRP